MHNFKFNFLSHGQLESLNLNKIFLPLLKILPCFEVFLGTVNTGILAALADKPHSEFGNLNFGKEFGK